MPNCTSLSKTTTTFNFNFNINFFRKVNQLQRLLHQIAADLSGAIKLPLLPRYGRLLSSSAFTALTDQGRVVSWGGNGGDSSGVAAQLFAALDRTPACSGRAFGTHQSHLGRSGKLALGSLDKLGCSWGTQGHSEILWGHSRTLWDAPGVRRIGKSSDSS